MERVAALVEKLTTQLAEKADKSQLKQTAVQLLAALSETDQFNNLPNNVSVMIPGGEEVAEVRIPSLPKLEPAEPAEPAGLPPGGSGLRRSPALAGAGPYGVEPLPARCPDEGDGRPHRPWRSFG